MKTLSYFHLLLDGPVVLCHLFQTQCQPALTVSCLKLGEKLMQAVSVLNIVSVVADFLLFELSTAVDSQLFHRYSLVNACAGCHLFQT